jgi:hypothetical protein
MHDHHFISRVFFVLAKKLSLDEKKKGGLTDSYKGFFWGKKSPKVITF